MSKKAERREIRRPIDKKLPPLSELSSRTLADVVECKAHVNDRKKAHAYLNLYERADGATVIPDEFDVFNVGMLRQMVRQEDLKFCLWNLRWQAVDEVGESATRAQKEGLY
jgi:hypothetical protein